MDEEQFVERSRALLDDSAGNLDGATLARLHAARNRAVGRAGRRLSGRFIWAGSALATAALLTLMVMPGRNTIPGADALPLDDLELIVSVDDPAQLEELEFYDWLAVNLDAS